MTTAPRRRRLQFVQTSCDITGREDLGAPAMLVHGALASLEALTGAEDGFDAQEVADALRWKLRSVQSAIAQLRAAELVQVVETGDKRVRRYRLMYAQNPAHMSAQDSARIEDKSARKAARMSARNSTEVRAESCAHLDVDTSSPDQERSRERGTLAPDVGSDVLPKPAQTAPLARVLPLAARRVVLTDDDVVRQVLRDGFEAERLEAPEELDRVQLGRWCRGQSEHERTSVDDCARTLADRFFGSSRARAHGYPLTWLVKNPLEYWNAGRDTRVGDFKPTSAAVLAELERR